MIDVRLLRDDPEALREAQRRRGEPVELVDELVETDEWRRASIVAFENLRGEQKSLGARIARASGEEKQRLLIETQTLSGRVKEASAEKEAAAEGFDSLLRRLPNPASADAPAGGEEDFRLIEEVGVPRDFAAEGLEPQDHLEVGRRLGAIDTERGAKVSGSRFYFLTGAGARLELALTQLAMSTAQGWGFTPVIPPALVKPEAMEGTGFLGQAAADVYHLGKDDDLYLVGTSEVPMAAYHGDEILDPADLPLRYVAFSPCYRREAGSHGRDTRGIFRVHWFDKVEMFVSTSPEDSFAEHERLLAWEREWLDALELPYRVIDVAAGDLGLSAARKFDCEVWVPSQQRYREISSTSNCTTFQSRRLGTRVRAGDGSTTPVATLNGTLCAMTRTILALLENGQQADGSVRLPPALHPLLGEVLEPVA